MPATLAAVPKVLKVAMAGIGYGDPDDTLETLLGSCVGVAIWDKASRVGALAHVVLPDSRGQSDLVGKFADTAIAAMCDELVRRGAYRTALQAKIAGGAAMFGPPGQRDVGSKNVLAVRAELQKRQIPILAEHVGGNQGRVIRFRLQNFAVEVSIAQKLVAVI